MKTLSTYRLILFLALLFVIVLLNDWLGVLPIPLLMIFVFGAFILVLFDQLQVQRKASDADLFDYQASTLKANREANLKSQQLETIIQSITFPLLLLDQKKAITRMNQSFIDLHQTQPIDRLSDIHSEILRFIEQSFLREQAKSQQILIYDQDYDVFSIPIYETQRFSGMLFIFQNITEVLERERNQKRFIADASHELKTPISAIKGMIEILNRTNFDDSLVQKEFQTQIQYETQRMDNIVQDMLQLSKVSARTALIRVSDFDLESLIHEVIQSYMTDISHKKLSMEVQVSQPSVISCDRDKLYQVLSNLLSNAIKYTEHGWIRMRAQQDESEWTLHIEDSGQGIKAEHQERIFDRFFRIDESRSRATGGSGLGLAIAKTTLEAMGGSISVQSQYGEGSHFTLRIPK